MELLPTISHEYLRPNRYRIICVRPLGVEYLE
jgi:hypothetical protein